MQKYNKILTNNNKKTPNVIFYDTQGKINESEITVLRANNPSAIKCVIFDFDNTMYYSDILRTAHLKYLKEALMILGGHTEAHAETLMHSTGFTIDNPHLPAFSSNLTYFKITKQQWQNFTMENYYQLDPSRVQIVPNDYYHRLAARYPLYIVTNEYTANVVKKAARYGIDLSPFKIYGSASADERISKKQIYEDIIKNLNISPSDAVVIGDRLKVDIYPLLELSGKGILVTNTDELKRAVEELLL